MEEVKQLRETFLSGKTRDIAWRTQQLKQIIQLFKQNANELNAALKADLGWNDNASTLLDSSMVTFEAQWAIDHLKEWMKPTTAVTPLFLKPAYTEIVHEPLGVVLVLGPWNYPIQLIFNPLIAAIAAGNCVALKPSEVAANCSRVIAKLVPKYLDTSAVKVFEGGVEIITPLLKEPFDHFFYTGNSNHGKKVAMAAAEHLATVTLELGGKNPCIVDRDANLSVAAKRIAWGKFTNTGQTCLAPDYLIVHPDVEHKFIEELKKALVDFYGPDPKQSPDYTKIINQNHVKRIRGYLDDDRANYELVIGGVVDEAERYFSPTILRKVSPNAKVMQDEIFGPILPILDTTQFPANNFVNSIVDFINTKEKALAFYVFTSSSKTERTLNSRISFGGGCVNECLVHAVTPHTPFGGVGYSGQGSYHGKFGFDRLSHHKTILHNGTLLDPSIRYPPYTASRVALLTSLKELNPVKILLPAGVVVAAMVLAYYRNSLRKFL
jgi:aldehyde dehydrogenase (NAD+)